MSTFPTKPKTVVCAIKFLWVSLIAALAIGMCGFINPSYVEWAREKSVEFAKTGDTYFPYYMPMVFLFVIGTVGGFFIYLIEEGKSFARHALLILVLIDSYRVVTSQYSAELIDVARFYACFILNLSACLLLFHKTSSAWFTNMKKWRLDLSKSP